MQNMKAEKTAFNSLDFVFAVTGLANLKGPLQCRYQVFSMCAALIRF